MVAAAYGHDPAAPDRAREVLTLQGFAFAAGASGPAVAKASVRPLERLLLRHLRDESLAAVKAMFRFVGIRFTRTGLLKVLPVINVPAGSVVSDLTTRTVGRQAREYYRTLPSHFAVP